MAQRNLKAKNLVFTKRSFAAAYENSGQRWRLYHGCAALMLSKMGTGNLGGYKRWLDIGCGTGISTEGIFSNVRPAMGNWVDSGPELIMGVEPNSALLDFARYKFGNVLSTDGWNTIKRMDEESFSPQTLGILKEGGYIPEFNEWMPLPLVRKILNLNMRFREHSSRFSFENAAAHELGSFTGAREFDAALASHVIHWMRREGIEYERESLSAIARVMKKGAPIGMVTSAADFRLSPHIHSMHVANSPFYARFREIVYDMLGKKAPEAPKGKVLDCKSVRKSLEKTGFEFHSIDSVTFPTPVGQFIEWLIMGVNMQVFQKEGVSVSETDHMRIIQDALRRVLDEMPIEQYTSTMNDVAVLILAHRK